MHSSDILVNGDLMFVDLQYKTCFHDFRVYPCDTFCMHPFSNIALILKHDNFGHHNNDCVVLLSPFQLA